MPKLNILHTADSHFANKREMLNEAITVTDFIVAKAEKEKPDFAMVTGDLYEERVLLDSPAALAGISFIRRLSAICPVLVVKGTELHDFDSLDALQGLPNVMVVSDVREVGFKKGIGFYSCLSSHGTPDAVVFCLPSLSKSFLISLGMDAMAAEEEVVRLVGDVFRKWAVDIKGLREKGVVTLIAGHGTVAGAITSTGQVMLGHDLTYGTEDFKLADADYAGFGHIHKEQKIKVARDFYVYYCGSSGRVDAGEKEDKGFYMVELTPGKKAIPQFILTPARSFLVKELGMDPALDDWRAQLLAMKVELDAEPNSEKLVPKIKVIMSEANASNMTRKDVEDILGRPVIFDKKIIPIQRSRAEGISRESSARGKFIKWAESAGQRKDEKILLMVDMLELPTEQLLELVKQQLEGKPEECNGRKEHDQSEIVKEVKQNQEIFALS